MAINFPNSPVNGDIYGNFTYDTSIPGWRKTPENSASLPAGTIVQWPGATAPANWLIADGAAVSRTTYASLFAAIGVQYGSGDGSTTFNLPNLKGRVAVGLDSAQTEFNTLGETGGAKTHTLTSAEMPSHTHTQDAHTHTFSGSTNTTGAHTHSLSGSNGGSANLGPSVTSNSNGDFGYLLNGGRANSAGDHSHTYSGTTSSVAATNQNTGGGGAHNNLQPYIVLNYIIKTSAGITSSDSELATRVGVVEAQNNATPLSQNYIINGGFDFWQRGTSSTNSPAYLADRWYITANTSGTQCNQSRVSVAANLGAVYALKVQQTSSVTVVEYAARQFIESQNLYPLAGKTVAVSFWYRSNRTGTHSARLSAFTRATGGADVNVAFTVSVADTWARYSLVFNTFSSVTAWSVTDIEWGALLDIGFRTGNTYGFTSLTANDYFEITGVQLEQGSSATAFRRNSPSIQAELAACQRYYQRYVGGAGCGWFGAANSSTGILGSFNLPVVMRVPPAVSASGSIWVSDQYLTDQQATSASIGALQATNTNSGRIVVSGFSGLTTGRWYSAPAASLGSGYIDFSAEL